MRKRRFWRRVIRVLVACVVIPPLFGLFGTVVGMMRAFRDQSRSGTYDADALAANTALAMQTTVWGLTISFVALVALAVAIARYRKLPRPAPGEAN